jgi:CRISPR/Cas system-associated exonuclease Cas4 (RecB family)
MKEHIIELKTNDKYEIPHTLKVQVEDKIIRIVNEFGYEIAKMYIHQSVKENHYPVKGEMYLIFDAYDNKENMLEKGIVWSRDYTKESSQKI